jgi:spermidine/putrescine-binding protein
MSDTPTNRKAADRLADIREQIRILKSEEAAIRQGLVDGELDLEGDDYIAVVTIVVNERIDLREMRQHVAVAIWRP